MNSAGKHPSGLISRIAGWLVSLIRDFIVACWEVLKLPFVLIAIGWKRFFALGKRKVLLLLIAAVVVTIVAVSAFVEATSQPAFCVTCHYMQPYFDAWRASTHNQVSCVTCHVPPGMEGTIKHKFMAMSMVANYMTGVYKRSKPWAEIDDAACLRDGCHETRLLSGKVNFKNVVFDHHPHLTEARRDRQLRCTSCHASIVQGEHISVTEGTCFLCHLKPDTNGHPTDLARCTHCHIPPTGIAAADTAFDHASVLARNVDCVTCHVQTVSGDGFVPPERCSSCHAKVEHIQRYKDLVFVHQKHVTEHKVECLNCHIAIRHSRQVNAAERSADRCTACHGSLHRLAEVVWKGELPGVPPTPSAMAKTGMTCVSCHSIPIGMDEEGGRLGAPVCTPCHEESYNRLWPMWSRSLGMAAQLLENRAYLLHGAERDTMVAAMNMYQAGIPLHNPDLLPVLSERITGVAPRTGSCGACHPAADNATPQWKNRRVPHSVHAAKGLSCETCHFTESSRHGALTSAATACNECHHRGVTEEQCTTCHEYQNKVYSGTLSEIEGASSSAMSAAEVTCAACHTFAQNRVNRADAQACVGCHDESYADTLRIWQTNGDSILARLDYKLKTLVPLGGIHRQYVNMQASMLRDGSRSVHNPSLFSAWLKRTEVLP